MRFSFTKLLATSFSLALASTVAFSMSALAQGSEGAADQAAFSDDGEMLRLNEAQLRDLEMQERSAENVANMDSAKNQQYRLYAEKKIQELEKLKGAKADSDSQVQTLRKWLQADSAQRARDLQIIRSLQSRIARLEQTQQTTMANLGNDIGAVREAANDARSDTKFKQMMSMNYFNEMQTEMGAASWYPPRGGGANYNMGGMGFNGGQQLFGGY